MMTSGTALLTATAVHLGFQATVTSLVYPALARVSPEQWSPAHLAHSRAITPLVAVLYGALALASGWALISDPGGWTLVSVATVAATGLITIVAAWIHRRLGAGHDPQQLRLLIHVDRLRAATAALALASAILALG